MKLRKTRMMKNYMNSLFSCSLTVVLKKYLMAVLIVVTVFLNSYSKQQNIFEPFELKKSVELNGQFFNYQSAGVRLDNHNNFIVNDPHQGAFLIFDEEGNFLQKAGRQGRGPGEFEYMTNVKQLKNDGYLAVDMSGFLHLFGADGQFIRSYNTPFTRLTNFIQLNDQWVLIPGFDRRASDPKLLHLLHLGTGEIKHSFFESPFRIGDYGGILSSMLSVIDAIADEHYIYAFISFLNNMYIFDYDGNMVRRIEGIDFEYFSALEKQPRRLTDSEKIEVMSSYSSIMNLFFKDDNTILIQHWRSENISFSPLRHEVYRSLAAIDLEGNILFEEKNTPRVYDYNKKSGTYLLQDTLSLKHDVQKILEAQRKSFVY